jgi:hypothetical protein
VSRLRYLLLGVLTAAVAAVVAAALLVNGERSPAAAALPKGQLLAAAADLYPQSFLFGQPVHVRIDAVIDRRKLSPSRIRLDANWAPYTPVAPMTTTREDVGNYTRMRWSVDLHCLDLPCAPRVGSAIRNVFQPTTVRYAGRVHGAGIPSVTVTWPTVIAWSRLDAIDPERKAVVRKTGSVVSRQIAAFTPPWHVNTTLAAVSYRIGPGIVFWGALAAALGLLLGTAALLRPFLPAGVWGRRRDLSKLERALAAVERARGRPVEERKALEALAAELRETGERRLAWAATELAWSAGTPAPEQTGALTESIRREVAGRTNGHRA